MMRIIREIRRQPDVDATKVTPRCEICPRDQSPFARMVNDELVEQMWREVQANLQLLESIMDEPNQGA